MGEYVMTTVTVGGPLADPEAVAALIEAASVYFAEADTLVQEALAEGRSVIFEDLQDCGVTPGLRVLSHSWPVLPRRVGAPGRPVRGRAGILAAGYGRARRGGGRRCRQADDHLGGSPVLPGRRRDPSRPPGAAREGPWPLPFHR